MISSCQPPTLAELSIGTDPQQVEVSSKSAAIFPIDKEQRIFVHAIARDTFDAATWFRSTVPIKFDQLHGRLQHEGVACDE